MANLLDGTYKPLANRKITEDTCRKFGYRVGRDWEGTPVHIADYFVDGEVTGQKLRYADKTFPVLGKIRSLFGQQLWNKGKMLVITEGEIDAMSVSQVQQNKWPVVSIPNGSDGAKKAIARAMESGWLDAFETIILMFDNDEPGREAVEDVAPLFEPGRVKIATLPMKDASDMLVAGRGSEIINAIWQAKPYRPDGIVRMSDLDVDELLAETQVGLSWPWSTMTTMTYGRQRPCIYMFGAGTNAGKTDVFTQIIAQTITEHKLPCAVFYLEQPVKETIKRIAGKIDHKRYHIPASEAGWSSDDYRNAVRKMREEDRLFLYDHFGSTDWDVVKSRIRFLAHSEGIKDFFIDHLTAFAALADDERKELEKIMAEMSGLVQELGITIYAISHLATPDGTPHEEGGRVMVRHFKGSRSIGFWSHCMFGLERDQQAEDENVRTTLTVRGLKDRLAGDSNGKTFYLRYDRATGLLNEVEDIDEPSDFGFQDETEGEGVKF